MIITQHDLPDDYTLEIGRILIKWAYFETQVQQCIYTIMGVDDVVGRVAIREPRIPDRLDLIQEIAFLRGFALNEKAFKELKTNIIETNRWRDLLAHSTWLFVPEKGWLLRDTRGNMPQELKLDGHAKKRKITPEGKQVPLSLLQSMTERIDILIKNAQALEGALVGLIEQQLLRAREQHQGDNP
ncbi:hypothetical protein [Hyphomonas sp. UBA4494]|jgi:hypothetical protein|uniref:hypothetical protein n=1 Tax=Hyphomonas sp. UBA4494 TaxID=1946631 RepID=UPI0025B8524C|nr:hypothetical protein [Hyphomonas sp. UBA4494]